MSSQAEGFRLEYVNEGMVGRKEGGRELAGEAERFGRVVKNGKGDSVSRIFVILSFLIVMSGVTGCATTTVVPEPGKITLREAMEEVATGLNRMYEIRANSPKSGLLPSEVTVVFNISASATDKGRLFIEAGAKAAEILKVTGVGAEIGTQVAAARGNTVTVKFTNVLFAPKDTLVMHKSPEDLKKLLEVIKLSGIEIQLIE